MHVNKPAHLSGTSIVTLADAKEFLRVDHSDEDTTIGALLDAAVAWVEDYTNRHLRAGGSATFSLSAFRTAALAYGPVTAITAVQYDDTSGAQQPLNASKYYYEKPHDGSILIHFHDTPDVEDYNAQPVRIVAAVGAAPSANVKHAVKMLAAHWYENRRAVVTGTITAEVPIAVEALLNVERIIDSRQ